MEPVCSYIDLEVKPCKHYIQGGFCTLPWIYKCIEFLRRNMVNLSYSGFMDYCTCRRKYFLHNVYGLELIEPSVRLRLGKIASECLDLIHHENPPTGWLSKLEDYKDIFKSNGEVSWELVALEALLRNYVESGYGDIKGVTQYEFNTVFGTDSMFNIHGYLDLVTDGKMGWEFKYTGNINNYTMFHISPQLSTYFLGVDGIDKMTLRLLEVPGVKKTKKESMEDFAARTNEYCKKAIKGSVRDMSYWRTEFNTDRWRSTLAVVAGEIKDLLDKGIVAFYQTGNRMNCWSCQFFKICSDNIISEQLYRKRTE